MSMPIFTKETIFSGLLTAPVLSQGCSSLNLMQDSIHPAIIKDVTDELCDAERNEIAGSITTDLFQPLKDPDPPPAAIKTSRINTYTSLRNLPLKI